MARRMRLPKAKRRTLLQAFVPLWLAGFLLSLLLSGCERQQEHSANLFVFGTIVEIKLWGASPEQSGRAFSDLQEMFQGMHRDWHAWEPGLLVEINEAFAAQYLGCEKELGLKREITNINGSGIGLGHPVGATGTRIIVTLIHALKQKKKSLGLATLCGGGGVSMACAIEII